MQNSARSWSAFLLRWTIAIVGIGYVIWKTPLYDQVTVLDASMHPVRLTLAQDPPPNFTFVNAIDPQTKQIRRIPAEDLVSAPDRKSVMVQTPGGAVSRKLLALRLTPDLKHARELLIERPDGRGQWIGRNQAVAFRLSVPYPVIDRGLVPMVQNANPLYLWLAILIFPITFIITSLRWHELLRIVGIEMGATKTFVVNMVGAFYNTFMPGSTGGDVLKAYYAAKLAPERRTRAVVSVIVDRAVGLLALILLGGTMAGYLAYSARHAPAAEANELVAQKCFQVAIGAVVIIFLVLVALMFLYIPALRQRTGLRFLLKRLPMQKQLDKAKEAMQLYRRRPLMMATTLLVTFPVHMTVIVSATFAGRAFGLPLKPWYYWVVVPVVVLSGSIPISPQGAGVMEFFAILLMRPQGATVSQAFALTMSIRLVQIFWNLTGGIFVARGGYHSPTPKEQEFLQENGGPPRPLAVESVLPEG